MMPWKHKQLVIDYQQTFGTPHGKRVLYDLMGVGRMLTSTYDERDSHASAFNEGLRNAILHILRKLHTDPARLQELHKDKREEDSHG
jgi:hypothetical protein